MDTPITSPRWASRTLPDAAARETLADAALAFAAVGIAVFPCTPGGKAPLTPHGFKDASADPERVARWWHRTRDANVGLPTGAASGVDVVDVDVHGDASGFAALARAREAGLVDGWVWAVRTPSGGGHLYFPHPAGVAQRSWQSPRAHVDFRGDGGYVVVPPSRTEVAGEVRRYEVVAVRDGRPGPVDAAALRTFVEPPALMAPAGFRRSLGSADPERLAAQVRSRAPGGRNGTLFWAACRMVEAGFDYPSTLGALGNAALDAGLSAREAETTVRSAYRTTAPRPDSGDPPRAARDVDRDIERDGLAAPHRPEGVAL